MKKMLFILTCAIIFFGFSCNSTEHIETTIELSGEYLGQNLPGNIPVRFGTGEFISHSDWMFHGPLAFSPNGDELYFAKIISGSDIQLYYSKRINDIWTKPQKPSFLQTLFSIFFLII